MSDDPRPPEMRMVLIAKTEQLMTENIERLRELTDSLDGEWIDMKNRLTQAEDKATVAEKKVSRLEGVIVAASAALLANNMVDLRRIMHEASDGERV